MRDLIYYEDQRGWCPADYYALFRYFNRLFDKRSWRSDEVAALDLARMSPETKHLLKHMLVQKNAYERVLGEYPNLADLGDVLELDHALYLSEQPKLVYPYFTEHGIYL